MMERRISIKVLTTTVNKTVKLYEALSVALKSRLRTDESEASRGVHGSLEFV